MAPSAKSDAERRADTATPDAAGVWRKLRPFAVFAAFVLTVGVLYWAKAIFIPLAVSTLLTFVLSPLVRRLQRLGLGRGLAVVVLMVLFCAVLGAVAWTLAAQVRSLADELPQYRQNILRRVSDVVGVRRRSPVENVERTVRDVMGELSREPGGAPTKPSPQSAPRVVAVEPPPSSLSRLPDILSRWLEPVTTAALVAALLVFMLLRREQLRDRIARFIGFGRLTITTKALDEAAERVSRYLAMQAMVNATFAICVGTALFFVGIPYAALWGVLAGILRFIPYVGPWIAAALPTLLALAVFSGWTKPLLSLAVFVGLEPLVAFVLEPMLYGHSIGVSEVALLVAIAFWTWLWGPVGLVLATPLTVCVVVFGKYVPEIEFLTVLMSDHPALAPEIAYYQRLIAADVDEATDIAERYVRDRSREALYEDVLMPALGSARRDRARGVLSADEERLVVSATRDIVEDDPASAEATVDDEATDPARRSVDCVVACPARDDVDRLALAMLARIVDAARVRVVVLSPGLLGAEVLDLVARAQPAAVCVGSVAPGGLTQARYLAKRLRARFPQLTIVVGRWGESESSDEASDSLRAAGVGALTRTLADTRARLLPALHVAEPPPAALPRSA